jgi:hypothetical protein
MIIYIYSLEHPLTGEVRYIGKTKNLKMRFKNHCNKLHNEKSHKRNWINSLRKEKLRPVMKIVDEVSELDWKYWEKYWIEQFRQWGFNLVNHTSGGEGLTVGNQTSFKKGNISWNKGKGNVKKCFICDKEFQSSKTAKKISCSKECASIVRSIATKKTQFTKESVAWNKGLSIKLKPDKNVYQFNKQKTIMIKKWNSAKEAGNTLNINIAGIGQCARGASKSCGGYYWNYKNILL